jgi:histone acetyltransferase (RNA polymerase elongator complex component)
MDHSIKKIEDIEDIENNCKTKPQTHIFKSFEENKKHYELFRKIIIDMSIMEILNRKTVKVLWKKYKKEPSRAALNEAYLKMVEHEGFPRSKIIEEFLITKKSRSISGVSVCAIFLSPYPNGQKFSCKWNCHYCPNEPGQPRSYLFGEPGVLRANQNNFDCVEQLYSRINVLKLCGHPSDKFEILIYANIKL